MSIILLKYWSKLKDVARDLYRDKYANIMVHIISVDICLVRFTWCSNKKCAIVRRTLVKHDATVFCIQ